MIRWTTLLMIALLATTYALAGDDVAKDKDGDKATRHDRRADRAKAPRMFGVYRHLDLSDAQKAEIGKIHAETLKKIKEIHDEESRKIEEILTDEQREKLNAMHAEQAQKKRDYAKERRDKKAAEKQEHRDKRKHDEHEDEHEDDDDH